MASMIKLTIADVEAMPEDGNRYELIEGELHVSTQPSWFISEFVVGCSLPLTPGVREPTQE